MPEDLRLAKILKMSEMTGCFSEAERRDLMLASESVKTQTSSWSESMEKTKLRASLIAKSSAEKTLVLRTKWNDDSCCNFGM